MSSARSLPYLGESRKGSCKDLKLQPMTDYVALARQYNSEFPSERAHLEKKNDAAPQQQDVQLRRQLQEWDPANDANIAGTDPFKTVFVGRLSYSTDELVLQQVFAKYGEIVKIRVVRDPGSGKSRGYAFILFQDPQTARVCTRDIGVHRGIEIDGRRCIVDIERGRTVKFFKPRRLGGGLGGRGYTSQAGRVPDRASSYRTPAPPPRYTDRYSGRYSDRHTDRDNTYRTATRPAQEQPPRTTYRSRTARQEVDY